VVLLVLVLSIKRG